jgi:uncharacterized protein (TIGR02266 family)
METKATTPTTESSRTPLQAELRVYYGPSQKMVLYGFSVDMSSGGLFLKTEAPFSVDEKVMLSFTLPDADKVVNCSAKVAWVNSQDEPKKPELSPGVGLQFLDLSTDYLMSIQSLLKHDGVKSISEPEK